LVIKIGAAKSGPKRDIHPEGAMVAVEGFVEVKVTTTGVKETMRDPDTVNTPLAPGRGRRVIAEPV
jgi:hypothetical protein